MLLDPHCPLCSDQTEFFLFQALLLKTNKNGFSCLYVACQIGHLEVAKALVEAGGEALLFTTEAAFDYSCLHIACTSYHAAVAALLAPLPCAGLIGLRSRSGRTALDVAVDAGHAAAAEAVLAASARPAPPRPAALTDPVGRIGL